jgi:hypothetical protein
MSSEPHGCGSSSFLLVDARITSFYRMRRVNLPVTISILVVSGCFLVIFGIAEADVQFWSEKRKERDVS